MNRTLDSNPERAALGLAILRVVVGIAFIAHGAQKLFTMGFAGVTDGFEQMGVPIPAVTAPLNILLEFLGGIALAVGLGTRIVAVLLACDMVGAIVFVHLPAGFFLPNGYEFVLTLLAANIALALAGPGRYSVDAMLAGRRR
jgi:putative oxidoreductase